MSIEQVVGGAFNDTITGDNQANRLEGGGGNDTITGGGNTDSYFGNAGNDSLVGGSDRDYFEGGDDNDTLIGAGANDTLRGGPGNDSLSGGADDDIVDGGTVTTRWLAAPGTTSTPSRAPGDLVSEGLGEGTDNVISTINYALAANVENLVLTGSANINGTGNGLDNSLTGNSGDNSLTGGAGNDTLDGGAGSDTLSGGTGNDTYVVDSLGDVISEGSNAGTDVVQSSVSWVLADNVENLALVGSGISTAPGTSPTTFS
jgi:Ca2+-binding RTX toxin-like protein